MASIAAPSVRAIPTRYRDTMFRSRTEARWAVFLDRLKIRWQYEVEGWDLGFCRYIPDFWLPDDQAWLEVKRPADTLSDEEVRDILRKSDALSRADSAPVILGPGFPEAVWYSVTCACPYGLSCSNCDATYEACESVGHRPDLALFVPGRVVFDAFGADDDDLVKSQRAADYAHRKTFDRVPFPKNIEWRRADG
jgi:hypothetical protein